MREVKVQLGDRSYSIRVQPGILDEAGAYFPQAAKTVIVTDSTVRPLYASRVDNGLKKAGFETAVITIPAGENYKNRETLERVYDGMFAARLDRSSTVAALGGGVVGDIAGFAAATFMRGIRCVQLPTTLLAAVDSSVGGKTGINHPRGKNMIGAFHQPSAVLIDPSTLRTLPPREISAGMAEVIKYGVIRDAGLFEYLEESWETVGALEPEAISGVIARCCRIKADVVAKDERESGLRAILNYGHTFAHALESHTGYGHYRHGEAVAIGMDFAARLAVKMKLVDESFVERQANLLARFGLPTRHDPASGGELDTGKILELLHSDKKAVAERLRFVLPKSLGSVFVSDAVTDDMIRDIL